MSIQLKIKFPLLILFMLGTVTDNQNALGQTELGQSLVAPSVRDEYAVAATHYTRGNLKLANAAFQELIERHPETQEAVSARFFIAEVYMQMGDFSNAYRGYQVFQQRYPGSEYIPRAAFRMGEAAYWLGRHEVALRVLEQFVRSNSDHRLNEFALPYLGEIRLNRGEPQLAQRAFETGLKLFPSSSISNRSRLGLAKSFQAQGNDAEAMRFYEFLATQPNRNLYGEAKLQMGIISFSQEDFIATESHLREAVSYCDNELSQVKATYWLARTYNELDDHVRALELLKTVVEYKLPEKLMLAVLFDGAMAADKVGRETLALEWLQALREKFPDHELVDDTLGMSIEILERRGESDRAMALRHRFRKSHLDSPLRAGMLEAEGRAHYAAKRYRQAIEIFETLLKEDHTGHSVDRFDRGNWRYLMSLAYLGLGNFVAAESELRLITIDDQTDQLKPLVQLARATSRFGAERFEAAIPNYRSYLTIASPGAEVKRARAELVVCLAETDQWDDAAVVFDELQVNHAGDPLIIETAKFLAETAYDAKQNSHAERWFTLMANPDNEPETIARGLSGLAWIKMETDDLKSAYHVFERLLTEYPESKFSSEAAMARAKHLEARSEFAEAAQTYGLVIRQFGSSKMANVAKLRRAYSLQMLGGEVNLLESQTLLKEYLSLPSDNPLTDEALYQLGWVQHDLGKPNECIDRFAELVDAEPESKYWPDAAYRVIQREVVAGRIEAANQLMTRLISRDDLPAEVVSRALFMQGQIAARVERWNEVEQAMRSLLHRTIDPQLGAKSEYWLAESLYRQKRYADSRLVFENLVPAIGQLDAKLEPWVLLRTAQCHGYLNDWISAAEIAIEAKRRFPEFETRYEFDFILARGLEDEGKLADARSAYERVIQSPAGGSTETAAISQWRIGETYFHQNQYKNAIQAYHKVDSLFSFVHWRSAALIQAGKCQEHLKNNLHAIKLYTQLIENFPETEFVTDAKRRVAVLKQLYLPNGQAERSNSPNTNSPNTKSRR
ncbi:MAG: TolA-binding protein [Mariniblastus sp.]|jgi:TolA-binding protein